jgi:hypothetical protein
MPQRPIARRGVVLLLFAVSACAGPTASSLPPVTSPPAASSPAATAPPPSSSAGSAMQPPGCVEATLAHDPSTGAMLLLNCVDQFDASAVERIWSWDGSNWQLIDDDGPPATVVAGVAFDPESGVAIRYGGLPLESNDCSTETWSWSAGAWSRLQTDAPTACDHMFLAHDSGRGATLLFGGGDDDGNLVAETWGLADGDWRLLTADGPAGRAHFGFLYDEGHDRAFLYGGYDGDAVFDDFWEWDGTAWTELDLPGPGPRSHFSWAIDDASSLLLFGGASRTSTFQSLRGDSWRLTDGRWTELDAAGPPVRGGAALGYDATRAVFVLYGGFDADGAPLDDTWEWSDGWRCVAGC